jgi:hypothetical protein
MSKHWCCDNCGRQLLGKEVPQEQLRWGKVQLFEFPNSDGKEVALTLSGGELCLRCIIGAINSIEDAAQMQVNK